MTPMQKAAQRVLEAWDSSTLLKAGDGMLQERMESLRAELAEPVQEPVDLPPLPTDVLSLHGPIWSRILDWNDASIGEEALRAADEITRVVQEQMQAYARAAVAAQSRPAEPQEPTGCAHCTHPLYAGVKCRSCGRARA